MRVTMQVVRIYVLVLLMVSIGCSDVAVTGIPPTTRVVSTNPASTSNGYSHEQFRRELIRRLQPSGHENRAVVTSSGLQAPLLRTRFDSSDQSLPWASQLGESGQSPLAQSLPLRTTKEDAITGNARGGKVELTRRLKSLVVEARWKFVLRILSYRRTPP